MDIFETDKLILRLLDAHNERTAHLVPDAQPLTLSAEQRAFVIQVLQRFSRETITTKPDRVASDLGQILLCLAMLSGVKNMADSQFSGSELRAAADDMIKTACRSYIECRYLCNKDLQPKSLEVLAWVQSVLVSEKMRAGGSV